MTLFAETEHFPSYTITLLEDTLELGVFDDPAGGIVRVLLAHHHPGLETSVNEVPDRLITSDLTVKATLECPVCYLRGTVTEGVWETLTPAINPTPLLTAVPITGGTN